MRKFMPSYDDSIRFLGPHSICINASLCRRNHKIKYALNYRAGRTIILYLFFPKQNTKKKKKEMRGKTSKPHRKREYLTQFSGPEFATTSSWGTSRPIPPAETLNRPHFSLNIFVFLLFFYLSSLVYAQKCV